MPKTISGAVGRNGRNFPPADVMTVQYLLNCVPVGQGGPSPELAVDGAVGPKTIAAIEKFQRAMGAFADGRVDPGGSTLRALQQRDPYPHQSLAAGGQKGAGQPAGKGGMPQGKSGGHQQAGFPGKSGDPFGKGGGSHQQVGFPGKAGGNQGGFPTGGKGSGSMPPGKTGGGGPFANNTGFGLPPGKTSLPLGGKGGPGGKGF